MGAADIRDGRVGIACAEQGFVVCDTSAGDWATTGTCDATGGAGVTDAGTCRELVAAMGME
eukprot:gene50062-35991_t